MLGFKNVPVEIIILDFIPSEIILSHGLLRGSEGDEEERNGQKKSFHVIFSYRLKNII